MYVCWKSKGHVPLCFTTGDNNVLAVWKPNNLIQWAERCRHTMTVTTNTTTMTSTMTQMTSLSWQQQSTPPRANMMPSDRCAMLPRAADRYRRQDVIHTYNRGHGHYWPAGSHCNCHPNRLPHREYSNCCMPAVRNGILNVTRLRLPAACARRSVMRLWYDLFGKLLTRAQEPAGSVRRKDANEH